MQKKKNEKNIWTLQKVYTKRKLLKKDTFEDLQDTYEFSKNHDYEKEKDDFEMGG